MTRDDLIAQYASDLIAVMPTNVTLSPTNLKTALNAGLGTIQNTANTVDPTKKPTIRHLTDIEY